MGVSTAHAARRLPEGKQSQSAPKTIPIRIAAAGQTSSGDANTKPTAAIRPQAMVTNPVRRRRCCNSSAAAFADIHDSLAVEMFGALIDEGL